jgi:carbonic anhydrase
MADPTLLDLLEGNRTHVESLPEDHFADVQDGQRPTVVSVCCSDSRVAQEGMWGVDEPGWLFTPSNIGNQAWDVHDGERVVDGNLLYPLANTGTRTAVVVGHTGCGAVTAAYRAVAHDETIDEPGISKWVESLVPVVKAGLDGPVDETAAESTVVDQLVEYNVTEQASFLRAADDVPEDARVFGFVYDFQGIYGEAPGRTYLVDADGVTDPEAIAADLPEEYHEHVRSLLG